MATIFSLRFFCLASSSTFLTLIMSSSACESTVEDDPACEPLEPEEDADAVDPEDAEDALRADLDVDHVCSAFLVTFSSSSGYSFANCHPVTHMMRWG
jgi:hypothetical protein